MPVAIDPADIPVLLVYNLDPNWTDHERSEVANSTALLGEALLQVGHPTTLVPVAHEDISQYLNPYSPLDHIVLNWCECLPGIDHSEWMVADCIEKLSYVFTGADSRILELSQDKCRVKHVLTQSGVAIPRWSVFTHPKDNQWSCFPAIVKPAHEHSSIGITRDSVVMNQDVMRQRIAYILDTYQQPALVEDFIDGREFHVSLWGNGRLEVLPPAEMDFSLFSDVHDRLCTYDAKFIPGSDPYEKIQTLLPAPLDNSELQDLEATCKAAYRAVGCRDYARIDVRYRDHVFYVLDVNPNADISMDASMACSAEVAGFTYGEMGSYLVRLAARRHAVWGT
ncbi:MAG: D-alanine--D-alanine ligase family protein [Desulfomonilia bacterium]